MNNNNNNNNNINKKRKNIKNIQTLNGLYFSINNNIIREDYIEKFQPKESKKFCYISNFNGIINNNFISLLNKKLYYQPIDYNEYDIKYASKLLPNDDNAMSDKLYNKLKKITYHKSPNNEKIDFNKLIYYFNDILRMNRFELFLIIYNYLINNNIFTKEEFFNKYLSYCNTICNVIESKNINFIKWIINFSYEINKSNDKNGLYYKDEKMILYGCILDYAYGTGSWDIINYIKDELKFTNVSTDAMDNAASNGHLHIIEWLHNNRTEGCTTKAMNNAAENGHLHIVEWLHYNRTEGCTANGMFWVAIKGHFNIFEWLHYNRTEGCNKNYILEKCENEEIINFINKYY